VEDWLRRSARCPLCNAEFPEYLPKPKARKYHRDPFQYLPLGLFAYSHADFLDDFAVPLLLD